MGGLRQRTEKKTVTSTFDIQHRQHRHSIFAIKATTASIVTCLRPLLMARRQFNKEISKTFFLYFAEDMAVPLLRGKYEKKKSVPLSGSPIRHFVSNLRQRCPTNTIDLHLETRDNPRPDLFVPDNST